MSISRTTAPTVSRPGVRLKSLLAIGGTLCSVILLLPLPWMAAVIAVTLLWDQVWLRFSRTGLARWLGARLARWCAWAARQMLKDERDAPYLYTLLGLGLL